MIPIIYEKDEVAFTNNGLGRLRDCIECKVVEERNSIYEADFSYPVDGANYDLIQVGRIIGVTHEDSEDIQPFDIVSYSKPLDGVVTFHCTHISYRQSYLTTNGTGVNSLTNAFGRLSESTPANPFAYFTDKTNSGYVAAFDGIPKTVRSFLGGMEGSILDAYGGEFEWDKWTVHLWESRGKQRDFTIRYGVNMLAYDQDYDCQGTYMSCVPYWTDGATIVVGNKTNSNGSTITDRGECVPLDLSDKFETAPTAAQLEAAASSYMSANNTPVPTQNIHVEFVRLQDLGYEGFDDLLECKLCDTINVVFPDYNSSGRFKIVKTVWDVLRARYESMELGELSTTLAQALGVSDSNNTTVASITQQQTITNLGKGWLFRKIGKVVYVDAPHDTTAQVVVGFNNIGTLDEGLRPSYPQYLKCTNVNDDIRLIIGTDGAVQLYSAIAWTGAHNCSFCGYCYLVD